MTTNEPTITCRFCERRNLTLYANGNLRFHRVPAGVDVGVIGIVPGDRCPGTSSDSFWITYPRPANIPAGEVWIPGTTIIMDAPSR